MNDWTHGYVQELDYTHDYYRELSPVLMSLAVLNKGRRSDLTGKGTAYCELGCGHGFSANLLAAANPGTQFHANDFNPAHIAGARRLAQDAGLSNAHFYEESFAAFGSAPGLPVEFDVIALHGVLSWVSAENRQHIIDFIGKRLKPGGVVYVSYNALPGWAPMMPLRRIAVDRAERGEGPLEMRIEAALRFADALVRVEASYFRQNASAGSRLEQMKTMSRNYLAHEYFNRDWQPFYFEDVARELQAAKLTFAGSANLLNQVDDLALSEAQRAMVDAEGDPVHREGLRDLIVNEQFRNDLFVKGSETHTFRSSAGSWLSTRFALMTQRSIIPLTVKGQRRNLQLHPEVHGAILGALEGGPRTVRDMLGEPAVAALNWNQILQALIVLVGAGHVQPCLPFEGEEERAVSCRAFNHAVCTRSEESEHYQFLASPVTGAGVALDRFEQLFLLAMHEGRDGPAAWAGFVWQVLAPQGQKLLRDGIVLETPEANLTELSIRAAAFASGRLALCRQLKVTL